jgi:hypothetical protein
MSTCYFTMCVASLFELLCRLWCTWLLQHVVNEVVHLIVGGVPQACHVGLCQKFFLKSWVLLQLNFQFVPKKTKVFLEINKHG